MDEFVTVRMPGDHGSLSADFQMPHWLLGTFKVEIKVAGVSDFFLTQGYLTSVIQGLDSG